ncbi:zinc-dependent alcohol dehydrogenase family protein [Oceanispirochaeta sp.]|jgi:alcohol dehydrogenase|uniref:zinc-dependent alcohol dehydrogenase family protein n=1 Tax=Oceanispirochaeta sp. TaxID=2035350 RepID=UPI002611E613|nr:zinc-dependent alcohol dehydrogenase family protein [Oceanispirochaeta sp.]MDA3957668.1 zinc-dependent alcohol dehydrogenase family protein [Oceanispirochaeta sp.]
MKAACYEQFQQPLTLQNLPEPSPADHGVVIKVEASGLCRSDWHGWMGHDPDISLPHVPGHELAGTIAETGKEVRHWKVGDRVTVPFVCACGSCPECATGNQQICDHQTQPGFTHWGSFAEYVALDYGDVNLVSLPESMDYVTAASLGCRFVTSFRAVVDQGRLRPGEWVAVYGCGGVGLSAIMIAKALGAQVVAIDIGEDKLAAARSLGADQLINASVCSSVVEAVKDASQGGVHLSLDALGSPQTCFNSISGLRKRGRHVQIGLMLAEHSRPALPMDIVISRELEILGSHGIQAHRYPEMLGMIASGLLAPEKLVGSKISLTESLTALTDMDSFRGTGVTVIDRFY